MHRVQESLACPNRLAPSSMPPGSGKLVGCPAKSFLREAMVLGPAWLRGKLRPEVAVVAAIAASGCSMRSLEALHHNHPQSALAPRGLAQREGQQLQQTERRGPLRGKHWL